MLQKLLTLRAGQRSLISSLISKLCELRENGTLTRFNNVLSTLEKKTESLTIVDEKILAQTDIEGMEEEILLTGNYSMEINLQLTDFRDYKVAASRRQQEPTTHSLEARVSEQTIDTTGEVATERKGHTEENTDEQTNEETTVQRDGAEEMQRGGAEEMQRGRAEEVQTQGAEEMRKD